MTSVIEIEGIGPAYAEKLKQLGIASAEALLKKGASPQGRQEIAEKTGISPALILRWVNHADLFRIKGVAGQYAELLEAGGVDTIPELAQRNPENLYQKLLEVNQEKKLVRRPPTQSQVKDWVQQAKQLARVVTY
jgi:predicted flap endonuclease-1-like 5' DNA nuclease